MALRIRKDGRILCAAMHGKEDGDVYFDDDAHYKLSIDLKVIVTEDNELHKNHGQWWWKWEVPVWAKINRFYLEK